MIEISDQDSKQMDIEIFRKPIQYLINDRTSSTLSEYIRSRYQTDLRLECEILN